MAIDSAAKRNSAMLDPGNLPWPPDGTIAVGDRLVMLEFYSGISAAEPAAPPAPLYRPRTAVNPNAYRPGSAAGPAAYRPLATALPGAYRPVNPTLPSA